MPSFLPDTSCMIAAMCGWHEHHARVLTHIERRLERKEEMIGAAPALVEAYAVLTRLPAPHRLSGENALALLEENFMGSRKIVVLDARGYRALLSSAPTDGVRGGRTYYAVILACARRAGVDVLLTLNEGDFVGLADGELEIVVP